MQCISQCFQWVIYVSQQTGNANGIYLLRKLQASLTNRMGKAQRCHSETSSLNEQHPAEICLNSQGKLYEGVGMA